MKSTRSNIEAIYPLSPLQQGMLFHSQSEPTSGVYIEQFNFEITGELNRSALQQAWKHVIQRYTVLRTLFTGLDKEKPRQVVLKHIDLPWQEHDWREYLPAEQTRHLDSWLHSDREQGFKLNRAPLIRLTLIQMAADRYQHIWTFHHALLDGWSNPIVQKDFFAYYKAEQQGRSITLASVTPYQHYILWLTQQDKTLAKTHWRQYLHGFSAPTPLMKDRVSSKGTTEYTIQKKCHRTISTKITHTLQTLARQEKITLNIITQCAWALLLSRYNGENDIVFGQVVSGRSADIPNVDTIVGPLINTLPTRIKIDSGARILPWLQQQHRAQIESMHYEHTSLIDIQQWSDVSAETGLFQSLYVFENYPTTHPEKPTTDITFKTNSLQEQDHYTLSIVLGLGKELGFQINYNSALLNQSTVARLTQHYQMLLISIADNPQQTLSELTLLSKPERQQILYDWNNTKVLYPKINTIQQLFECQAQQTPQAIAVEYQNQQLSYQTLNEQSNQLAHRLIELGVNADTRVGLCVDRSVEMAIGVLAILKAGGAYVPLDTEYPKDRLAYMLSQADVSILLTQNHLREQLPSPANTLYLDADNSWCSDNSAAKKNPVTSTQAQHLAYVLFTSGSTGRPKAVAMPHQALINLVQWQLENSDCKENTRTLQFSPISFDVSFQELFSTWGNGGTLVLISEDLRRDPILLWTFLAKTNINRLFMPFIALQQLAQACAITSEKPLATLQEIITAGEQLQITPLIRQLFKQLPGCKLYNHYGPSETHVVSSLELNGSPHTWEPLPTIGTPIANNTLYILDSRLQPVPVGVTGEMYSGGIGVARGYLGQSELTQERFIPNPFSEGCLYKTGDLACYRPDGSIDYKGRADDQLKIRGFRIELGEIENALIEHVSIQEAVVVAHNCDETSQDKYLTAYVVTQSGSTLNQHDLSQMIKAKLPDYMVPSVFMPLEILPLTPSGKVDRRALPLPDTESLFTQKYVAPRTEVEQEIATIWANILQLPMEKIGINDNFFDLGGHSIHTLKITMLIKEKLNLQFSIKDIYTAKTIKGLIELTKKTPENKLVFISEADLDNDIKPCGKVNLNSQPQCLLLTGSTGFIGRFLLRTLLDTTNAKIYCLVRANCDVSAHERLESTMQKWDLWNSGDNKRIVAIHGDLAQPQLGITNDTYELLTGSVDMIFHNATHMNHLATYDTLKAANINGLKDIIRLASTKKQKLIQYISTTGIFSRTESDSKNVDENSPIDSQIHYHAGGYTASKWISEKLLMNAQAIGIPSNIYRLGLVSGDSKSGRSDSAQWLTRLIKICAELKHGFDDKGAKWFSIIPVDFVSLAIVKLALEPIKNKVFHIENPEKMGLADLINKHNEVSTKKITLLPFNEFKTLVRKNMENNDSISFIPFIHGRIFDDKELFSSKLPLISVDSTITNRHLQRIGIEQQKIDSLQILRYFSFVDSA